MTKSTSTASPSGSLPLPYTVSPGLLRIPTDVSKLILKCLDPVSFNMAQRSCRVLRSICRSMNDRPIQLKSNQDFCLEVAKHGHLGILKWFYEMQIKQNKIEKLWDEKTCIAATERGHLEVLQWLREKGCPWDKLTCTYAAENGHLQVLQWARQNDCPWDKWTCAYAARNGHLHVLQWAKQNGCPWNKNRCLSEAKRQGHLQIVKWIEENDNTVTPLTA